MGHQTSIKRLDKQIILVNDIMAVAILYIMNNPKEENAILKMYNKQGI